MQTEKIPFEVTAFLGKTALSLSDYLGLQIGDILVLDQPIEKGLVTCISQSECFLATAGLFETHKAIIIDERIHSG
jgi:flagellar motor switch protein FliM